MNSAFKRIEPQKKTDIEELAFELDEEEHFLLPTSQNAFTTFDIEMSETALIGKEYGQETLVVRWIWKDLESSHIEFSGVLNKNRDREIRIEKNEIPYDEDDLADFIIELFPEEWDGKYHRYKISFDRKLDRVLTSFTKDIFKSWGNYIVNVMEMPVMPKTEGDALQWRDFLLEKKAEKSYLTEKDFSSEVQKVVEEEALMPYKLPIIPDTSKFMEALKKENKIAWWHLQAPNDLQ